MESTAAHVHRLDLAGIPLPVRGLLDALAEAGHHSYLVGGWVRDRLRGANATEFDVATPAPPEVVLERFPRAVAIGPRHGTVMIPTESGPVDVSCFRGGPRIEDDLGHRDFTVNAMAYDPRRAELWDPFGGRSDLAAGRLRAVRSARDRFAEDPLRALRAARLTATLEFEADAEVETAMAAARAGLRSVARERVRHELTALLLAPGAPRGLELLRRTGLEADLAPGAAADAVAVVGALPLDLELRLAAWLRAARAGAILRRARFPRRRVERVVHLLRLHPVEESANPARDAAVRRLIRRAGEDDLAALVTLRRAELRCGDAAHGEGAGPARERLRALEEAIERVKRVGALALRRQDLAIDGREVMALLACGPGPEVGRALSHLTDRVVEDPSCNTPEALRALLRHWAEERRASTA